MSNRVKVSLREEREVGFDFKPKGELKTSVYVGCDGLEAWIGNASNEEELMQVAGPENLIETMMEKLSCDEIECIMPILECSNSVYYIGDKEYTAKQVTE